MPRSLILLSLIVPLLAACAIATEQSGGNGAESPAATSPIAASTVVQEVPTSGIAGVDAVIGDELAGDGQALAQRLTMHREPCSFHPELGYPAPCRPGEVESQEVDAFSIGTCEGAEVRDDDARKLIAAPHPKTELYAVHPSGQQGADGGAIYLVDFDYLAPATPGGFVYAVDGDRITKSYGWCGGPRPSFDLHQQLLPIANTGLQANESTRILPLDRIIAAVASREGDGVAGRLAYESAICSPGSSDDDALHCANTRSVNVFTAVNCTALLVDPAEAERLMESAVSGEGERAKLIAIAIGTSDDARYDYRLFFAQGDGQDARGFSIDVRNGRVTRLDEGCGPIERRLVGISDFLRPPATTPARTAPDPVTTIGIADLDEISQLVSSGDANGTLKRTTSRQVPCGQGDELGVINCGGGETTGTPVAAFLSGSCEPSYRRVSDGLSDLIPGSGLRLYAIARVASVPAGGPYQRLLSPAYRLIFAQPAMPDTPTLMIDVGSGRVTAIANVCGDGWRMSGDPDYWILPPPDDR